MNLLNRILTQKTEGLNRLRDRCIVTSLKNRSRYLAIIALVLSLFLLPRLAFCNPQGGEVVTGEANITQISPSYLQIIQTSNRAVIDWRNFSISDGEMTQFVQPSTTSMTLILVTGDQVSQINGRLIANGQVILINPKGLFFGRESQIDVNSLIASTASVDNDDVRSGRFVFLHPEIPVARITNEGMIAAAEGGLAALVAPVVLNSGIIQARLGNVVLGGGNTFTIDPLVDNLFSFADDGKVMQSLTGSDGQQITSLVENSGSIQADGGSVLLTATAAKGVVDQAINISGVIQANSVAGQGGKIVVMAEGNGVAVNVSGSLHAKGNQQGEFGGTVNVLGDVIRLSDHASLDASGESGGGTILVGGNLKGQGPDTNASNVQAGADVNVKADASNSGDGGTVVFYSTGLGKYEAEVSANGSSVGKGGFVETSARILTTPRVLSVSGGLGAGAWLIDPDNIEFRSYFTVCSPGTNEGNYVDSQGNNWYWLNSVCFISYLQPSPVSFSASRDIIGYLSGVLGGDDTNYPYPGVSNVSLNAGRDVNIGIGVNGFTAGSSLSVQAGRDASVTFGAYTMNHLAGVWPEYDCSWRNTTTPLTVNAVGHANVTAIPYASDFGCNNNSIAIHGTNDGHVPINVTVNAATATVDNQSLIYGGTTSINQSTPTVNTPESKDPNNNSKQNSQAAGTDTNAQGQCSVPSTASKDPVDLATGYFYDTLNLMEVAAAGSPLKMALSYSSGSPVAGSVGFGWGHPSQLGLADLASSVKVTWPDRHVSTYNSNAAGGYTNSAADAADILVKNADGSFTLTDRRQKTYNFDASGKLTSTIDRLGFIKNFTYVNGNLDRVTDALSGRFLQFTYDAQNRVVSVTSTGAGSVSLAYSAAGDLASVTDALGKATTFTYDSNHRLLTKINALGATVVTNTYDATTGKVITQDDGLTTTSLEQFTYATDATTGTPYTSYTNRTGNTIRQNFDANFNLLSTIDPLNNTVARTYIPGASLQSSETDALNNKTQFTYDGSGYILTRTDALGNVASYTYDAAHNIINSTDEAGNVTTMNYDANHHLLTKADPAGKITTYIYNAQGLPATVTDPKGGATGFTYDANSQLSTMTDPVGLVTSFTYDTAGRVLTITDGAGKIWTKTYDLMGHLLTAADPLGNTTHYTYDALGRLATKTAPGGGVTTYAYDIHDNLTSITNPLGGVTSFAYNADDQLISTTDALGHVTTLTRDAKGRVITKTDALGNSTTLGYDAADNIITRADALNNVTTLTYDSLHRLSGITDPLNNQHAAGYDALSRVVSKTDGNAGVTSFAYDALSRLTSATDAGGGVAAQTFDENGNRLSFTDTAGNQTSITYDAANRIISITTADGGVVVYTYNSQNRIATATNGRGQAATYTYNNAGWLISMTDPAGTIIFTYDANGNVLTVADAVGISTYTYDTLNRAIGYADVFGNVISYGYDAVGNLTTLTYPGNKVVTYTYDAANRMTSVTDWANRLTSYTYNARGNIIAITRANSTSGAYTYDAKGQLASIAETFPFTTDNYGITFTYDANGNITAEVSTPTPAAPVLLVTTMTYGADNRLATVNGQAIIFDADGNMTSGLLNGAAATFSYDARSYLTGVGNSSYVYNAQGNRVSAANAGMTTRYVVDPNAALSRMLMETTATGSPVAYYVYGATGLISRESAAGIYQTYHYDLRGSTVKLADAAGAVTDSYAYGPFGELVSTTGTTSNPFKYNGRDGVMTEDNGLYYMRARYYSPEAKRFVNRDVVLGNAAQALTLNRFAYVNGNPVSRIDPSGLFGLEFIYSQSQQPIMSQIPTFVKDKAIDFAKEKAVEKAIEGIVYTNGGAMMPERERNFLVDTAIFLITKGNIWGFLADQLIFNNFAPAGDEYAIPEYQAYLREQRRREQPCNPSYQTCRASQFDEHMCSGTGSGNYSRVP